MGVEKLRTKGGFTDLASVPFIYLESTGSFILFFKIYLLFTYFRLHRVLVAARGIFVDTRGIFYRCGARASL